MNLEICKKCCKNILIDDILADEGIIVLKDSIKKQLEPIRTKSFCYKRLIELGLGVENIPKACLSNSKFKLPENCIYLLEQILSLEKDK